jgi:DNA-binding HxlR family transcriptional regulator
MENIIQCLFRFRWNIPVLAELYLSEGAKFVILTVRLGISRSVLRSTLEYLIGVDLVAPNPGYGHPMRPEYILTPSGVKTAPFCSRLVSITRSHDREDLLQFKWALPILFAIADRQGRFSELKARLAPITPRALSEELKRLVATGLIERKILGGFPPVSIYRLAPGARGFWELYQMHREELC